MELTAKQTAFATAWGLGATKADAYRQSYNVNTTRTDNALHVNANHVSNNTKVKLMADAVRDEMMAETIELSAFSRDKAFAQSQGDHALAVSTKQAGAANSCTKLSSQIAGHLTDTKEESGALLALAQLVDQVRAHGGDMPRGSLTIDQDGSGDSYVVDTAAQPPNPLESNDE